MSSNNSRNSNNSSTNNVNIMYNLCINFERRHLARAAAARARARGSEGSLESNWAATTCLTTLV